MQDGLISRTGASIYAGGSYTASLGNGASEGYAKPTTTGSSGSGQQQFSPSKCFPTRSSPTHSAGRTNEFKLCGYDGSNNAGITGSGSGGAIGSMSSLIDEGGSSGGGIGLATKADIFGVLEFWLKLRHDLRTLPWEQLRAVKLKNPRAARGCAYIPTEVEHIANVLTHGMWVLPSIYGGFHLYWRSYTIAQTLAAIIYGISLSMLFLVSTCFHCVCYCNHDRPMKDVLHRCDRAMIYIFIAGSYYPWLSLGHTTHPDIVSVVKWIVWVMAVLGIIYQQMYHERYKCLETFFYVVIGVGPSLVIVLWGHEFTGMAELKFGGILYIVGILFFKADGLIPFAHAIWHMFVVIAACVHYFAILTHLFPVLPPVIPNEVDGLSEL
ncbi:monocyte to macrophage differentiation factor [Anopheles darlingi]|uniref:monocyte to macrophage differentiation factor n=1 Tax=Anopheles darlingi TaxID=43151 RepID=UPI00210029B0|nr:monocyte to macrophage differentiation factor [Anopheles darlingi]